MAKYSVYISLFDAPPDIPLTLGDLVGRSFRTFRDQIKFVSVTLLWPTLLATLSIAGIRWCCIHWLSSPTLQTQFLLPYVLLLILCFVALAVAQRGLSVRSVTIVRLTLGVDSDYKLASAYAKRRSVGAVLIYNTAILLPLLVLLFWMILSIGFVYFFSHAPGMQILSFVFFAIVGLASTCTVCWTLLYSALAFTVLACEDLKLGAIWKRTYDLTSRYLWRGGSFMVLLGVTLFAVTVAVDCPLLLLSLFDAWRNNFPTVMVAYDAPLYLQIMSAIWDSVINILLLGVALIAGALYYNDLRLRLEGRDILTRLANLEV